MSIQTSKILYIYPSFPMSDTDSDLSDSDSPFSTSYYDTDSDSDAKSTCSCYSIAYQVALKRSRWAENLSLFFQFLPKFFDFYSNSTDRSDFTSCFKPFYNIFLNLFISHIFLSRYLCFIINRKRSKFEVCFVFGCRNWQVLSFLRQKPS